jgi:hypothetical protein
VLTFELVVAVEALIPSLEEDGDDLGHLQSGDPLNDQIDQLERDAMKYIASLLARKDLARGV